MVGVGVYGETNGICARTNAEGKVRKVRAITRSKTIVMPVASAAEAPILRHQYRSYLPSAEFFARFRTGNFRSCCMFNGRIAW